MELGHTKFINFGDYKKALLKPGVKVSEKSKEEILDEMLKIVEQHKRNSQ